MGIKVTIEVGARHLEVFSYSQLVVWQVECTFEPKEEKMIEYLEQIENLRKQLDNF